MEPQKLLEYIKATGYRTSSDIGSAFSQVNAEILTMTQTYLVEKGLARRVSFESPKGEKEDLYYIPV